MSEKKPYITPTIGLVAIAKGAYPDYHYNAGDNPKIKEAWTRFPQENIVRRVPIQLDIETTTVCNLECPMCFQAYKKTKPIPLHMDFDFYKGIINEFADKGGMSVKLMYRGDPLVTKNIEEWVEYANKQGLHTTFNTNGMLLTPQKSRRLIEAGLKQIIFSVDSHIPEEYEKIRRPCKEKKGDFKRFLENFKAILNLKDEIGSQYPLVEVSRVNLPETRKTLDEFADFWINQGAQYVSVVDENDYSMGKKGDIVIAPDFCCEMPWQRMFILADGLVTQCCGDLYQQYPLAQLATQKQIEDHGINLEKTFNPLKTKPRRKILEMSIFNSEKLEKGVIGDVSEDGHVTAKRVRVKGITGESRVVPLGNSVEEVWLGNLASSMRQKQRAGTSHSIKACADCGYRNTTIAKTGMSYQLIEQETKEPKKSGIIPRNGRI